MFILTAPILMIVSILMVGFFYALVIGADKFVIVRQICLSASLAALFICFLMALSFDKSLTGYQFMSTFNFLATFNTSFSFGVDGLSFVFLALTLFIFPVLFLTAWNINKASKHFFCHLLGMELLLVLTFVTIDLFYFFVLFESLLIPMFILIGTWGARTRKVKAAYYFFLYTLFGSLFMLFGMLLLSHLAGTFDYHTLSVYWFEMNEQIVLWTCFFIAFAVKMPLFPFHIWLPEAHVEAPTVGSMLLASLLLKLGGYGLLRFSLTFLASASILFTSLVAMLAICGIIYGSLSTLRQIDLKRIVAYSSVAHMNLVVLGLFTLNRIGIEGAIYLMVAHGVVSAALFFCVGVLYDKTHSRLIKYYGGLVTGMPLLMTGLFIFSLANMGFPGTPNFLGELLMLIGVFQLSSVILWPAALGIVFSAAYSVFTFNRVAFGTLKLKYISTVKDVTRREAAILILLSVITFLLGVVGGIILPFLSVVVSTIAMSHALYDIGAAKRELLDFYAVLNAELIAFTKWYFYEPHYDYEEDMWYLYNPETQLFDRIPQPESTKHYIPFLPPHDYSLRT